MLEILQNSPWWTGIIPCIHLYFLMQRAWIICNNPEIEKREFSSRESHFFWEETKKRRFLKNISDVTTELFFLQLVIVAIVYFVSSSSAQLFWSVSYPILALIPYRLSIHLYMGVSALIKKMIIATEKMKQGIMKAKARREKEKQQQDAFIKQQIARACVEILEILPHTWNEAENYIRFMRLEILPDLLDERQLILSTIERTDKALRQHKNQIDTEGFHEQCDVRKEIKKLHTRLAELNNQLDALYQFLSIRAVPAVLASTYSERGERQYLIICRNFCRAHDLPTKSDNSVLDALSEAASVIRFPTKETVEKNQQAAPQKQNA
jgi:K+ transporter